tara:strand:+ start:26 stop:427 length:402 start_codon:yes stop_codon:yes gene_type:complete
MAAPAPRLTGEDYDKAYDKHRDPETGKLLKGGPGRKPGTRNKNTKVSAQQKVREIEQQLGRSIDPLEGLAKIAAETEDVQVKLSALKELAKYLYPQRKAVDMSLEEQEGDVTTMSDADLESIIHGTFDAIEEA